MMSKQLLWCYLICLLDIVNGIEMLFGHCYQLDPVGLHMVPLGPQIHSLP